MKCTLTHDCASVCVRACPRARVSVLVRVYDVCTFTLFLLNIVSLGWDMEGFFTMLMIFTSSV